MSNMKELIKCSGAGVNLIVQSKVFRRINPPFQIQVN